MPRLAWVLVVSSLVTGACGASSSAAPPSGSGGDSSACVAPANAARDEMSVAIRAHTACKVDADCVLVGFAASCFDSCVDVVGIGGKAAVEAVRARVEAECKPFHDRGCKLIAPPCAPPSPPGCLDGVCR